MTTEGEILEKTLGPEWDRELIQRLAAAVTALSGKMVESSWGVGGSQEVIEYSIALPGTELTATNETYVGLQLRGPRTAVERLTALVDEAQKDV